MKKQLLFLSIAAVSLLAGCSKNEVDNPGVNHTPATHISAKARGAASVTLDTKAPVTGTSLDGQMADIYASTYDISTFGGDLKTTFSNVYGRGTMTFDDSSYVVFDPTDFGGKDGGSSLLPQDGQEIYLYGFYPKGWTRTIEAPGGVGTDCEFLDYTFDGKTDVMSTWLTEADNMKIKYDDASLPDRADLVFKHLLTRYNIRMKAINANAIAGWGRVKSLQIKDLDLKNRALYEKSTVANLLEVHCSTHPTNTTPTAFYKLTGTDLAKPTYEETKFAAADYASSLELTTSDKNACYTMVAPVEVQDADPTTAELTLVVETINASGKTRSTEIPVSLQQAKFSASDNYSTRGYSIILTLNFRAGAIQAIATVEEWKEYGEQNINVDLPPSTLSIGDFKDDGIVYWINENDKTHYKVFALKQPATTLTSCPGYWFMRDINAIYATDGRKNIALMKNYSATHSSGTKNFANDYPAANYCDTYGSDPAGTWYLPSKTELEALSSAYTANKTLLGEAIAANSGDAITATAGSRYLSCSSILGSDASLCVVDFSGNTSSTDGNYPVAGMVRCIRSSKAEAVEIGDLLLGGMVCEVTDNTHYKVMTSNNATGLAWAEKETYIVPGARSDTDGRANSDAIKAYYDAEKAAGRITSDFNTAFPAAAYCYNYKGSGADAEGTWYLPAAKEMQSGFWALNTLGTSNWSQNYITSTESTDTPANYYRMSAAVSGTISPDASKIDYINKSVRCLRSSVATPPVTPTGPQIGDVKDGGIVYWVDAADATKYKVFSLDDPGVKMFGCVEPSGVFKDDGRLNIMAMKASASNFETDYPGPAYCDAKAPAGSWYLPALNELVQMYNVWNTNRAKIDNAIQTNGGGLFHNTEQYMPYISSTYSGSSNIISSVNFFDGNTAFEAGAADDVYLRCIRSTVPAPPAPPKIGDLKDGGIIYEVNGANYKVFSLDQGESLKWTGYYKTGYIGAGVQSETDGKANFAAMKAFSANTVANSTTGVFATDFPAAGFCDAKNVGGVTGWYLPAKDELMALCNAYTANKALLDGAIASASGTAMSTGDIWSSSEHPLNGSSCWYVRFSNVATYTSPWSNPYSVRCIKTN